MKKLKAFTLVEVLIVVTIMALSITLVTAWTLRVLDSAELQATYESLLGSIRRTQSAALNSVEGSPHGIRFNSGSYTTFLGASYDTSDPGSRNTFNLPPDVQLTSTGFNGGGSDIVFQVGNGETSQFGTITIDHLLQSQPITISISSLGLID